MRRHPPASACHARMCDLREILFFFFVALRSRFRATARCITFYGSYQRDRERKEGERKGKGIIDYVQTQRALPRIGVERPNGSYVARAHLVFNHAIFLRSYN